MRTESAKRGRSILAGMLAALTLEAPAGLAQRGSFGGETTVVAVEIPVQVLADGRPVRGLTRESFEVFEGRRRQEIVDFEVVDLSMATTPSGRPVSVAETVAPAGRRHFLLLFDLTNSEPPALQRARRAASELVLDSLHPTDLVAVATWSYTKGPRLLLGFTSDRPQVDAAIASLGVVDLRNTTPDPLGLIVQGIDGAAPVTTSALTGASRGDIEAAFEENMRDFAATERAAARQVRTAEIDSFTQGLGTLANLMGSLDGRKHVVLLSQGFDSSMVVGSSDASLLDQSNAAAASGEIWNVRSDEIYGSGRALNQLEQMLTVLRRADCVVQAVDIGGMAAGGEQGLRKASGRDTLLTMAKDTGGQLFENFNDLGDAMAQLLESTSVTYVLTIQPQNLKSDGKFHELRVRLKDGPSGVRLVHRPGYYAPTPYDKRSGVERQIDSASLIVSGRPGGELAANAAVAVFRGEGERAHVPVVLEVDGALLLTARQGDALPLEIYLYAFDDAGAVRDMVAQAMQLDVAQVGARLNREPLKYVADLRLPPGRYALRTLVRAGAQGAYWLGESPVTVPAFAGGELVAVTPLAPEPMTSGVVVRSSTSAARTQGLPFPFVQNADFYLPRGVAAASKRRPARLSFNVYGLAAGDAEVGGRLLDAEGRPVTDAEVRVGARQESDQPGLTRFDVEVDPGGAADGDYTLELTVAQQDRSAGVATTLRVGT